MRKKGKTQEYMRTYSRAQSEAAKWVRANHPEIWKQILEEAGRS